MNILCSTRRRHAKTFDGVVLYTCVRARIEWTIKMCYVFRVECVRAQSQLSVDLMQWYNLLINKNCIIIGTLLLLSCGWSFRFIWNDLHTHHTSASIRTKVSNLVSGSHTICRINLITFNKMTLINLMQLKLCFYSRE